MIMQNKKVQYKMENNESKKVRIKNRTSYYFGDLIKLEDFDLDFNRQKITRKYLDLWHFM